jgi:hypothetical protein
MGISRVDARAFVESLRGRELKTLSQGKTNRVLDLVGDDVLVSTEPSPGGERVPLVEVQRALDSLLQEGELSVTVDEIGSHRSSFIGAALATMPGVEVVGNRPKVLRLRQQTGVEDELRLRLSMWAQLHEQGGPTDVTKDLIRRLAVYGGAQGVWVDAGRTRAIDRAGVAVGLLHTGRHYADILFAHRFCGLFTRWARPPFR